MAYLFGPKIAYSSPISPKNCPKNSFLALTANESKIVNFLCRQRVALYQIYWMVNVFGPVTGYLGPKTTLNISFWALNAKWSLKSKLFCHQWVGPLKIHRIAYLFAPKIAYSSPIWPKNSPKDSFLALNANESITV